jgi:hypothetical protein
MLDVQWLQCFVNDSWSERMIVEAKENDLHELMQRKI